jgi:hypothetical protein
VEQHARLHPMAGRLLTLRQPLSRSKSSKNSSRMNNPGESPCQVNLRENKGFLQKALRRILTTKTVRTIESNLRSSTVALQFDNPFFQT